MKNWIKLAGNAPLPLDRRGRLLRILLQLGICFSGGAFYAAALPPLNLFPLGCICLVPLLWFCCHANFGLAALGGWVWGLGWAVFSFAFLREIDPAVPFLIAPVLALWSAVFAFLLCFLRDNTLAMTGSIPQKKQRFFPLLVFVSGSAAWFVLLEWTRSRLFPWNDFSVIFWKVPVLLQIAEYTGHYGINFLAALVNAGIFALAVFRNVRVFLAVSAVFSAVAGSGIYLQQAARQEVEKNPVVFSAGLIQGNLSQRRHSTMPQAYEALQVYTTLSRELKERDPGISLIVWPEGAVPFPFYSCYNLENTFQKSDYARFIARYQSQVRAFCRENNVHMLIGALDFDGAGSDAGATNSALLLDPRGEVVSKYDKIHRVPFGEYIPFRAYFPERLVRYIDMGRDLVPGKNPNPMLLPGNVRAAAEICYEGVFSYLTRERVRRGADVLIVLSNDAWYPRSSEPEQHLANALLRAVETRTVMIRCGNNGGSGVVYPDGSYQLFDPVGNSSKVELLRCKDARKVTVNLPQTHRETFFVRYGEWFVLLLAAGFGIWLFFACSRAIRRREAFCRRMKLDPEAFGGEDPDNKNNS